MPGALMNYQFTGPTAWEDYLSALEAATPTIEAITVTDYHVTETYERVLEYKKAGYLPSVRLIFPNVELRLDVATVPIGDTHLGRWVSRRPSLATTAGHHASFPAMRRTTLPPVPAPAPTTWSTCRRSLPNGCGRCPWSYCVAGVGVPCSLLWPVSSQ